MAHSRKPQMQATKCQVGHALKAVASLEEQIRHQRDNAVAERDGQQQEIARLQAGFQQAHDNVRQTQANLQ